MLYINRREGDRWYKAVYLEPADQPSTNIQAYSGFSDKYPCGYYEFKQDALAPFSNYTQYEYDAHSAYKTEDERSLAFWYGMRLKTLHYIAATLDDAYKSSSKLRADAAKQYNTKIYLRQCVGEKQARMILESDFDAIVNQTAASSSEVEQKSDEAKEYKRRPRHWLLSTSKTLHHFGITNYTGDDYTYDRNLNKSPTAKTIYRLFTMVFHGVVLPNALIAKKYGKQVSADDVIKAMAFVMHANEKRRKAFHELIGSEDGTATDKAEEWIASNITEPVNFYVIDKTRDGKSLPVSKRWTLESYMSSTQASRHTKDIIQLKPKVSKQLGQLIDAFMANRDIGSWSYDRIITELKVNRKTVAKFMGMLKERRKSWSDYDGAMF